MGRGAVMGSMNAGNRFIALGTNFGIVLVIPTLRIGYLGGAFKLYTFLIDFIT